MFYIDRAPPNSKLKTIKPTTFYYPLDGFHSEIIDYHPNQSSGRLMLCLHGFGGNARTFRRLAPHLPEAFRMWSVSLPWHGKTTSSKKVMQLENYAHALAKMLDDHNIDRVDLMSHSFGARIAAMFASLYPKRTHTLYLIAPGGYYPPEDLMFRFLGSFPMRHLIQLDIFLRPFARFLIPNLPTEKMQQTINALRHLSWSFPAVSLKARGELARLYVYKGKTVLIMGEKDRLLKASYAPKIARYYYNCTTEIIPQAGHLPMAQMPEKVADIVTYHSK